MLDACAAAVRPGVTTDKLDRIAHEVTVAGGGYPSPLNYCSFPKSICTSVNEVICHGIPDARPLEDGDIVNLDISVYLGGFHADLNETVLCGNVDAAGRLLVRGAWECLAAAIAIVKPGTRFRDPGDAISTRAAQLGLSVVRCAHFPRTGRPSLRSLTRTAPTAATASGASGLALAPRAPLTRARLQGALSLRAKHPALCKQQGGGHHAPGHGVHNRANDQRGHVEGHHLAGRMDVGDHGRQAQRPVRAHAAGDGVGLRSAHRAHARLAAHLPVC